MKRPSSILLVTIVSTLIFGLLFHLYYALEFKLEYPFKETLSMSLSFLGSFGSLASIYFALRVYIDQKKKEKEDNIMQQQQQENDAKEFILRNKPKLAMQVTKYYYSEDKASQPALAVDLTIKNYSNNAYSFGLAYEYLPDKEPHLLIEFEENYASSTLRVDETRTITIIISLVIDIGNPPKLDDIDLYIKAVYLDKLNNSVEDYYKLKKSNRGENLTITSLVKSEILTVSGKLIKL